MIDWRRIHRERGGAIAGFTLVEIQVALVILGLVAVLTAGALRSTLQVWTRTTAVMDGAEHRFMVEQFVRKHLTNMRFPLLRREGEPAAVAFMGDSQSIYFVAPYPSYFDDGQLYMWRLFNARDEEADREYLALGYVPLQAGRRDTEWRWPEAEDEGELLTVAEDILLHKVEYLSRDHLGVESWRHEWELAPAAVPVLIKLQMAAIEKGTPWEETIITPRFQHQRLRFQGEG